LDLGFHFGEPCERPSEETAEIRDGGPGVFLSEVSDNFRQRSKLLRIRHRLNLREVFSPRCDGSNFLGCSTQQFATPEVGDNVADRKIPDEWRLMLGDPINLQEFLWAALEVLQFGLRFS